MTNDPRYHEATAEELVKLARQILAHADVATLAEFALRHYGEQAYSIRMEELGEYNDENYGYGQVSDLIDEQPFRVESHAGDELYPDLELPDWGHFAAERDRSRHGNFPMLYPPTETQDGLARARAFARRVPADERIEACEREDDWGDAHHYFVFLEEMLCELRFNLPTYGQAIDNLNDIPPMPACKVYLQEDA